MSEPRDRGRFGAFALVGAITLAFSALAIRHADAQSSAPETDKAPPSSAPAAAGPRSRLTLRGEFTTSTFAQKNFALGASNVLPAPVSDFDAFWTQELRLYPRLILSDDLNVNLRTTFASGLWGFDDTPSEANGDSPRSGRFFEMRVSWAYLSYQHHGTRTRWYLGRQRFGIGHSLVLDANAPGLQIYRDFGGSSALQLAFAKEMEGADGLTDANATARGGGDGRDADLYLVEWKTERESFTFNPFYAYYLDRGNADGATLLPDGLDYSQARFRPNISQATVMGVALSGRRGPLRLELEYDKLSGKDRVQNLDSGPGERLDMNNGDLTGSNLYGRLSIVASRLELGGTIGMGSGDPDPRGGEGNINGLRTDGYFYLTEIWEDTISSDEEGIAPGGLGASRFRGYRGLENTKVYQGHAAIRLRHNLRVSGSFSMLRSTEALQRWSDLNADGRISADEYGGAPSTELGSEFDARIDWTIDQKIFVALRGGMFFPRAAVGLLMYGTERFQEQAREVRLTVRVPIPEFSLGG